MLPCSPEGFTSAAVPWLEGAASPELEVESDPGPAEGPTVPVPWSEDWASWVGAWVSWAWVSAAG